jgi:large subunit ribosomal protein L3
MTIGIVGRKVGMTRVFTEDGDSIPVTVIEAEPNRVAQLRTEETDGYRAVQVTTGSRKASRVNKPAAGHLAKAGVEAGRGLWEFRLGAGEGEEFATGGEIKVDIFEAGQKVDVRGVTKGKGFQGVVKRYNFSMQDATHGNSLSHRAPGSIGQNQTPGRVFKGKKMSGHMGSVQRSAQNLEVVRVDVERNLLLVKGAVPGATGGNVIVTPAVKMVNKG